MEARADQCIVETLGREAGRIDKTLLDLNLRPETDDDSELIEAQTVRLTACMRHIQDTATDMTATSPAGALFQMVLAIGSVDALEASKPLDETAYYECLASISRGLTSALCVIEREFGVNRDEVGGAHYFSHEYREYRQP
jgi:hypothetical protein